MTTEGQAPLSTPQEKRAQPVRSKVRRSLAISAALLGILGAALAFLAAGTGYGYRTATPAFVEDHLSPLPPPIGEEPSPDPERVLEKLAPKGPFIVIDRVRNHLYLVEEGKVTLDALISTGAGSTLADPSGKRTWTFDTPVGRFKVKGRRENPIWTAPDWDYIESGEPFPRNYEDRRQEGMLGEYALDLDTVGYMIHGTLYERFLGRNVSHGCVRVGRDDLRVVWKKCPIGTTVFIY